MCDIDDHCLICKKRETNKVEAKSGLMNLLCIAFVQGAKFWEYYKTNATMWQSDQNFYMNKAIQKWKDGTLGKDLLINT